MSGLPPESRAAGGGGPSFGEEDRRLSYGSYLKIAELLQLQQPLTDAHDELLFITIHQAYELWFKLILYELEGARQAMQAGDCLTSQWRLRRVTVIESLLIHQVDVLDTMAPQDFLQFRHRLAPASGRPETTRRRGITFSPAGAGTVMLHERHPTAAPQPVARASA